MSVTAHGVAMAYVLTTFFIMGFGYFVAVTALARPLAGQSLGVGSPSGMSIVGIDNGGGDRSLIGTASAFSSLFIRRSPAAPGSISASCWWWSGPGSGAS